MADNTKTYYAWSPIHYHADETSGRKIIHPGQEVTASQLGYDKVAWNELLESGAVRPQPYPKGLDPRNPNALSPNDHRLSLLRRQREKLENEMAGVGGTAGDTTPSTVDDGTDTTAAAGGNS